MEVGFNGLLLSGPLLTRQKSLALGSGPPNPIQLLAPTWPLFH